MAEDMQDARSDAATGVLLCADDFAMTNGISRAIIELAEAGRLSAVSAMTTTTHWPSHATWLARVRSQVSAGLHLNLTLGAPLGPMTKLAPGGTLPLIGELTARSFAGTLDTAELAAEIERQIAAFEAELGFAPDHIDGHQHVHALPRIRHVLLEVLSRRFPVPQARPLLRDPFESPARYFQRGLGLTKTAMLSCLTAGFGSQATRAGFACNEGFGGVSAFAPNRVAPDFAAACRHAGPRHLVMCHPGFVDEELTRIDPLRARRQNEFDYLMGGRFPARIWRPCRSAIASRIAWRTDWAGSQ